VPCVDGNEVPAVVDNATGWVATTATDACSDKVLRAADTAVWLDYSPWSVLRAWLLGLCRRLTGSVPSAETPRLADVRDSLLHMAWTPQAHRLFRHPAMGHLQIFHLRNPDETNFWLRIQEQRLATHRSSLAPTA
jgi:hypothetical protein